MFISVYAIPVLLTSRDKLKLVLPPEQLVGRDRHDDRDHRQNRQHHPAARDRAHYCGLTVGEAPTVLVSFTLTEVTDAAFAETVKGTVSLNWPPNGFEAAL